jgi:hypothetical protein
MSPCRSSASPNEHCGAALPVRTWRRTLLAVAVELPFRFPHLWTCPGPRLASSQGSVTMGLLSQ